MKKYIISTLTAAAAMAVPAFADVELIDSWDFSSIEANTTGSIVGSQGTLSISTGSSVVNSDGSSGYLYITSKKDGEEAENTAHKTTIDISSEGITLEEGISVVLTITGWSSSGNCIFASIETDGTGSNHNYAAAIGETGAQSSYRDPWFAADGSSGNVENTTQYGTISVDWTTGITVAMTFIGDTLSLYQLVDGSYTLLGETTIKAADYSNIYGNITEVALASWDYISTDGEFNSLSVSSVEIWKGDVTTLPEPSMFGLMFGLGAIGLVGIRRRRR